MSNWCGCPLECGLHPRSYGLTDAVADIGADDFAFAHRVCIDQAAAGHKRGFAFRDQHDVIEVSRESQPLTYGLAESLSASAP